MNIYQSWDGSDFPIRVLIAPSGWARQTSDMFIQTRRRADLTDGQGEKRLDLTLICYKQRSYIILLKRAFTPPSPDLHKKECAFKEPAALFEPPPGSFGVVFIVETLLETFLSLLASRFVRKYISDETKGISSQLKSFAAGPSMTKLTRRNEQRSVGRWIL